MFGLHPANLQHPLVRGVAPSTPKKWFRCFLLIPGLHVPNLKHPPTKAVLIPPPTNVPRPSLGTWRTHRLGLQLCINLPFFFLRLSGIVSWRPPICVRLVSNQDMSRVQNSNSPMLPLGLLNILSADRTGRRHLPPSSSGYVSFEDLFLAASVAALPGWDLGFCTDFRRSKMAPNHEQSTPHPPDAGLSCFSSASFQPPGREKNLEVIWSYILKSHRNTCGNQVQPRTPDFNVSVRWIYPKLLQFGFRPCAETLHYKPSRTLKFDGFRG